LVVFPSVKTVRVRFLKEVSDTGCDSGSCDSCSTGSCSPESRTLPPGILQAYHLNENRSDGFLVWIELDRNDGTVSISESTRRTLSFIRSINDGSRVWGVVFGFIELKPLYSEIYGLGVETLYEVHSRDLVSYHPEAYSKSISEIIIRTEAAIVLFGDSIRANEISARVSAIMGTGIVSHCSSVETDGRNAVFISGGRRYIIPTFPKVATLDTAAITSPEKCDALGTVIYWKYDGTGRKNPAGL